MFFVFTLQTSKHPISLPNMEELIIIYIYMYMYIYIQFVVPVKLAGLRNEMKCKRMEGAFIIAIYHVYTLERGEI